MFGVFFLIFCFFSTYIFTKKTGEEEEPNILEQTKVIIANKLGSAILDLLVSGTETMLI